MSERPKSKGGAQRRKAGLRVPSDAVPRRPTRESTASEALEDEDPMPTAAIAAGAADARRTHPHFPVTKQRVAPVDVQVATGDMPTLRDEPSPALLASTKPDTLDEVFGAAMVAGDLPDEAGALAESSAADTLRESSSSRQTTIVDDHETETTAKLQVSADEEGADVDINLETDDAPVTASATKVPRRQTLLGVGAPTSELTEIAIPVIAEAGDSEEQDPDLMTTQTNVALVSGPSESTSHELNRRFVRAKTMALSDQDLEEVVDDSDASVTGGVVAQPASEVSERMIESVENTEPAQERGATTPTPTTAPTPPPNIKPPPAPSPGARTTRPPVRQSKPWHEEIFDEDYLRTLPFLTPQATQLEATFVADALVLKPGQQVLDVGCGYGRHAMELAARGYHVVGLDNSLPLLLRGADEAQRRGLAINFVHGDMRDLSFESQFDGAYCLFSSFGFFDDETNKNTAQQIARALKPNARLVIEVLNRDYVVADLPSRVWWEGDGCVVLEEVEFNYFSSRIVSSRSVVFDDGRQLEQEISIRSMSLHELGKLLHQAGFRVIEISGSMATRGRFFGAQSRDIVVVAEKRPDGDQSTNRAPD